MTNIKNYIGENESCGLVFQRVDSDGKIVGFDLANTAELPGGRLVMSNCGFCHEVKIGKKTLKTGMTAVKTKKLPKDLTDAYFSDINYCSKCGQAHECDDYEPTFVITSEGEVYCRDCVEAHDLVYPLDSPEDLFKAPDIRDMPTDGLTEVETLFCDSSGWGSPGEAALTKGQALARAEEILKANKDKDLFVGLTGVGQFQVYVTVFCQN